MKLKGSYTVEASIVISLCFLLFGTAVGISYDVFKGCIESVQTEDNFDAVTVFRVKESVEDFYEEVTED